MKGYDDFEVLARSALYDRGWRELRRTADGKYWDVAPDDYTAQKTYGSEEGFEATQSITEVDLSTAMYLYNACRECFFPPLYCFPPIEEWSPELLRRQLNIITGEIDGLAQASTMTDEKVMEEVKERGLMVLDHHSDDQLMDEIRHRGLGLEKGLSECEDVEVVAELRRREGRAQGISMEALVELTRLGEDIAQRGDGDNGDASKMLDDSHEASEVPGESEASGDGEGGEYNF